MSEEMKMFLDAMNARFDEVNARLDKMESRLDKLESRLDKVEKDLGDVKDFARMNFEVTAKAFEIISRIEKRLDENERATRTNSYDIAILKAKAV